MPLNQLPNAQTASEHFSYANADLKEKFIIYGAPDVEGVKLLAPEKTATLFYNGIEDLASVETAKPIHLTKKIIYDMRINGSDSTQTKLALVNQDGIFETLVWTTTPAHIQSALRAGVFSPEIFQNPLTKMIAQLGEYDRLVFKRSVEENFVVKHNAEKLALNEVTKDCIQALQPLYRAINNYDDSTSPHKNLMLLIGKLDTLLSRLIQIENSSPGLGFYHKLYTIVDPLIQNIQHYKSLINTHLLENSSELTEETVRAMLQPYANPFAQPDLSLQHFLQAQLNTILISAMETNYQLNGLFQDPSGLQAILVKTQIIAEGFSSKNMDYHNPYDRSHAMDFSDKVNDLGLVTIDLGDFGFAPTTMAELAKQVALIDRVDAEEPLFSKNDKVYGFFGINWRGNVLTPLTWLANGSKDILGSIMDLGYLIGKVASDGLRYMMGKELLPVNFPSGYSWMLKKDLSESKYVELPANFVIYEDGATKIPHHSILEGIYLGVARVFSRLLIEPLVSVTNIVGDELWNLKTARQIYYDATIAMKPVDETEVAALLSQRLSEMNVNVASNAVTKASFIDSYNKVANKTHVASYEEIAAAFATRKQELPPVAAIPYMLTPDNPTDFVSWMADDFIRGLIEVFTNSSYRNHPIAGLALSLAASSAAPMMVSVLGSIPGFAAINQNISVPIAQFLIGDTSGLLSGISTGLVQGQIAFLAVDMFNGRNSLLESGLKMLLENPVVATIVTLAAVGFGYSLAYEMQIPWLSQLIVSETDQATFPWFELAIAGAKIAAILIEGTLVLHQEHHHNGNDHLLNDAIEKLRPELRAAIQKGYLAQHNIASEELLTIDQSREIETYVSQYCDNVKKALKKPEIAVQISQLSYTIGQMVGTMNPASFNGVAPAVTDMASQNELLAYIERRQIRHQIAQLNPRMLTTRDKYIFLNYLTHVYPNDPDYVTAVRHHFEKEKKTGPLSETFKIIFSYIGAIPRAVIASIRSAGYQLAVLYQQRQRHPEKADELRVLANRALQPLQEFSRKIKNDVGLLMKGVASLLRTTWGLLGAIAMVPVTLILSLPAMLFLQSPTKIFSSYNKLVFSPGRISQFVNAIIGGLRDDASSKNLALATHQMDIRYSRTALNPGAAAPRSAAKKAKSVAPVLVVEKLDGSALDKRVLALIKTAFERRETLRDFVNPEPVNLNQLLNNLTGALVKSKHVEKLYAMVSLKPAFNRDFKAAVLEVINEIKQLSGATISDRQAYQELLINLIRLNRREPVDEIRKAYSDFIKLELPALSTIPLLDKIRQNLLDAQNALKHLPTTFKEGQSRLDIVTELLQKHNCLSRKSLNEIAELKKIVTGNKFISKDGLIKAEKLLHALGLVHKSAQAAAYRLAAYPPIVAALIQLQQVDPAALADAAATSPVASAAVHSLMFTTASSPPNGMPAVELTASMKLTLTS
jgi:hypothetical protein